MIILYNIHELKIGLKVIQDKEPCVILENEGIKPGKGLSFNRIRLKKIISGKILEKTLKSGECLESADVLEMKFIYVYRDGDMWFFMNEKNFDQISISSSVLGESVPWIKDQLSYIITFWNNEPILVTPPDIMELKVVKTDPVIKGSSLSASHGNKLATLSNGIIIKVPYFIQIGESIKVKTRSKVYVSRKK